MTSLVLQRSSITSRLLPTWLLRLAGLSTLAVALVNFLVLLLRRSPATRKQLKASPPSPLLYHENALKRTSSSLADIQRSGSTLSSGSPPYARTPSPPLSNQSSNTRWSSRLVDNVIAATSVLKKKKRLTISLKNTILWNPSQDADIPNHAFHENAVPLLSRLCQRYEVHLLIHINNEDEYQQIQRLLTPIVGGIPSVAAASPLLDKSRIHYCQDASAKLRLIQQTLRPAIHVEGGWELDDGEDILRELHSSVNKVVWIITRRRRTSFNKDIVKPSDREVLAGNVELTDSLLDTSLAREVGFFMDQC